MGAEHKDVYEMHEKIVSVEIQLKAAGWASGEIVSYNPENKFNPSWGVRYSKGDKQIFLNRFTVDVISTLL